MPMNDSGLLLILKGIPCSPDEGQAYIDAQLAKFEGFVLALKSARNNLSQISRLPQELLSLIFNDAYATVNYTLSVSIRVTHVCRTWRQIALNCTNLWSRPRFSNWGRKSHQDLLQETIARAKGIPLSIRMNEPSMSPSEFSVMLPPSIRPRILNLEHIQELHVTLSHSVLEELLNEVCGTDAHNMRSIALRDSSIRTAGIPDVGLILRASSVLSQNMPHLRHLSLRRCGVPWELMQLRTWDELRSLRLTDLVRPTQSQFFGLLSQAPNLEILTLRAALPAFGPDTTQTVTLSKLSSCTIESSSLAECLDFQSHVSYPYNTAKLYFAFRTSTETAHLDYESSIAALLSSFGLSEQHSSARSHRNLLLDVAGSHVLPKLRLALWDDPTELDNGHPRYKVDNPSVSVKFPLTQSMKDRLLSILLISGLKAVYFNSKSKENFPDNQWLYFFRRHPEITRLHLRALSAPVFRALSLETYEPHPSGVRESEANSFDPPLPHLDAIIQDRGCDLFSHPTIYQIEYNALVGCLVGRRERDMAVRKVSLPLEHEDGFQAYGLERIQKEVEELVWVPSSG